MTPAPLNIDALVAEVIRRLQRLADVPDTPRAPSPLPRGGAGDAAENGTRAPIAPRAEAAAGDLVIDTRVVTMADIERRLSGVRRVLVPRGAVVTPSVKDDLRKRHVRLEFATEPAAGDTSADALVIARCTHTPEAARAAAALTHPAGASVMKFDDLRCAAQTLATIIADANRVGVLLTDDPLSAVCLANRLPAARAAWVRTVAELPEAITAIGLNVLVVHPAQCEPDTWQALLTAYRQGLPRRSPPRLLAAPGQC